MNIREFQDLMKNLYFHQDNERGVEKTFLWLIEEVGELSSAIKRKGFNKTSIGEEMADIIAWICSLANLLNIDIETALLQKYPGKCLKCGSNPCRCNKNIQ